MLGLSLVVQIITGVILSMYYKNSTEGAYISIEKIMREIKKRMRMKIYTCKWCIRSIWSSILT